MKLETFLGLFEDAFAKPDDCWEWQGGFEGNGAPQVYVPGRSRKVHRLLYELLVGPLPPKYLLVRRCGSLECVNPAHRELVTKLEFAKKSGPPPTRCIHGHSLEDAYVRPGAHKRICRTCSRRTSHAYYLRKKCDQQD